MDEEFSTERVMQMYKMSTSRRPVLDEEFRAERLVQMYKMSTGRRPVQEPEKYVFVSRLNIERETNLERTAVPAIQPAVAGVIPLTVSFPQFWECVCTELQSLMLWLMN